MDDAKEEIRDRLSIEDVVGEYVELKRAGRNFKALSPFNNEKTPSFIVSPDKKIWHDFSSGKGGDVFSFIMEMEGFDFTETMRFLARKAGVELKQYSSKNSQEIAKRKAQEQKMYRLATKFYQLCLSKNQHAMEYAVKNRRLNKTTLQDFAIGYSPNLQDSLVRFLLKKGFSKQEIERAGLTNQYGGDLFRGRMMIPLSDQNGQVIGYTARGLEADSIPKYLNTPSTLLYDKSRHVFALAQAKEAIRKSNQAVLVEGNMDAISSHQAGVKHVVAAAGTALTVYHLKALARFTSDIRLAFDGDSAGIRATERAIILAQDFSIDLKIISMPDSAKDPDELIGQDVKLWKLAIDEALPAVDWLILQYDKSYDLSSAQGKRDFGRKIMAVVKELSDPVEREAYVDRITEKLGVSAEALLEQTKINQDEIKPKRLKKTGETDPDQFLYQDDLLAMAFISAEVRHMLAQLPSELWVGDERREVAKFLIDQPDKFKTLDVNSLPKCSERARVISLRAEEKYQSWSLGDIKEQVAHLIEQTKKDYQKQQKQKIEEDLRVAEATGDEALTASLLAKLTKIIKQIKG